MSTTSTDKPSISVECVQCLAGTQQVNADILTKAAWEAVGEHVTDRVDRVMTLASRICARYGQSSVSTQHVNMALQQYRLPSVFGHNTPDLPKLHYIKDHKLYARNDGVVDLAAVAGRTQPSLTTIKQVDDEQLVLNGVTALIGHKTEPSTSGSDNDVKPDTPGLNQFLEALETLMNERLLEVVYKVFSKRMTTFKRNPSHLDRVVRHLLQKLDKPSHVLPSLVCLQCCSHLDHFESHALLLVDRLLDLLAHANDQKAGFAHEIGRTLAIVARLYPSSIPATNQLSARLRKLLSNRKTSLSCHVACLIVCRYLGWQTASQLDWLSIVKSHVSWRPAEFEEAIDGDVEMLEYVLQWRQHLCWLISRMRLVVRAQSQPEQATNGGSLKSEAESDEDEEKVDGTRNGDLTYVGKVKSNGQNLPWIELRRMERTMCLMFGESGTALVTVYPSTAVTHENGNGIKKHDTTSIRQSAVNGRKTYARIVSSLSTPVRRSRRLTDTSVDSNDSSRPPSKVANKSPAPKTNKRPASGNSGALSKKRRLRKPLDWFEVPRSFRGSVKEATQFIFVFHSTNATVIKDQHGTRLNLMPPTNKPADWVKFARRINATAKTKRSGTTSNRRTGVCRFEPCSGLDVAHLML